MIPNLRYRNLGIDEPKSVTIATLRAHLAFEFDSIEDSLEHIGSEVIAEYVALGAKQYQGIGGKR